LIKAVVFDFDGLILDTETPDYQSWQAVYQAYGCELPLDLWMSVIGRGSNDITFDPHGYLEKQLECQLDRVSLRAARRARMMDIINGLPILPGVTQYLTDAKQMGLKIGLASSSRSEWVNGHLNRLKLADHFECVRCGDEVARTKPDPELYQTVLKAFDIQPHEAIAFEDSANGALAAKRAGMFCVVVPNPMTCNLNFDHADYRLESMLDMPLAELIQRIDQHPQTA
jgi:HAD superfamily hydrolase (TIGR01509 family)